MSQRTRTVMEWGVVGEQSDHCVSHWQTEKHARESCERLRRGSFINYQVVRLLGRVAVPLGRMGFKPKSVAQPAQEPKP